MLLLLTTLFKAPDILQKVEEYTGHCIVPEGVVCTPMTLITTLGLLCCVGAILSPATPASYNQLQTTTNIDVVTSDVSITAGLGIDAATTGYPTDIYDAIERITASGSRRKNSILSAPSMIWEDSVLTNSSVVHIPLHTTNVDSTMFSTTIGLPTSPAAARTFVVLMQNMDQTEHTHDAMRKNPAWPHNIMLVPNNNYGEMKYFILLKYLNLMRNGYPCNLLN